MRHFEARLVSLAHDLRSHLATPSGPPFQVRRFADLRCDIRPRLASSPARRTRSSVLAHLILEAMPLTSHRAPNPPHRPARRSPLDPFMSSIDVEELEVRVRRRLALVDARRQLSDDGKALELVALFN